MPRMRPTGQLAGVSPIWILVVLGCTAAAALIPLPRDISAVCVVSPRATWTLSEPSSGRLESRAVDGLTGAIIALRLFQFERSSFVSIEFTDEAREHRGTTCPASMPVARVTSSELEMQVTEQLSAVAEARANLQLAVEGSKPADLDVATVAMELARAELDGFAPELRRTRALHEQGVATDSEMLDAESEWQVKALALELAEAQLHALASGAGPAKISEAQTIVDNAESELLSLRAKHSAMVIETAIGGDLLFGDGVGEIPGSAPELTVHARVAQNDTVVVHILMDQKDRETVELGQQVRVHLPGASGSSARGVVSHIEPVHFALDKQQVFMVRALVPNPDGCIEEGMRGTARILRSSEALLTGWVGSLRSVMSEQT